MQAVGVEVQIDDNQLLRRQIARHCIFGVDINPIAVELAKLSIWIHTFVPGLPLSLLDYNLIPGNSLVGIATLDEISQLLSGHDDSPQMNLFGSSAETLLGHARESLERFSHITDSNTKEIAEAKQAFSDAKQALRPTEALFDIAAASRMNDALKAELRDGIATRWLNEDVDLFDLAQYEEAQETFSSIKPLHFPLSFPQVFLRERQGFDVILGNPPWDEATIEEDQFWTRYIPGLQGNSPSQQNHIKNEMRKNRPDLLRKFNQEREAVALIRETLLTGPYPDMGTGDPDLYKAFSWRFWNLLCHREGTLGVVLPRSIFSSKGSSTFRETIFSSSVVNDLCFLKNKDRWVFEDVTPQYTIALLSLTRNDSIQQRRIPIKGPFRNISTFNKSKEVEPVFFSYDDIQSWTDTSALPMLPSEQSALVFNQLRKAPRLDLDEENQWRTRPNRELDATNDKKYNGRDLMLFTEQNL